jgi:hypothetical protein
LQIEKTGVLKDGHIRRFMRCSSRRCYRVV